MIGEIANGHSRPVMCRCGRPTQTSIMSVARDAEQLKGIVRPQWKWQHIQQLTRAR